MDFAPPRPGTATQTAAALVKAERRALWLMLAATPLMLALVLLHDQRWPWKVAALLGMAVVIGLYGRTVGQVSNLRNRYHDAVYDYVKSTHHRQLPDQQ